MKKLELYHKRRIGTGEKYINELVYSHLINYTLDNLISQKLKNKLKLKVYFRRTSTTKTIPVRFAKMYIRVDMSFLNILETITHELVHLKQYSTGQLNKRIWKSDNRVHYRWEKKEMGVSEAIEYKNRPWEVEAFAKQFPLVEEWTNYIKEPKNWTKQNKLGLIWDVVLDNVRLELNKLNDRIASKNNNERRKQLIGG